MFVVYVLDLVDGAVVVGVIGTSMGVRIVEGIVRTSGLGLSGRCHQATHR